MNDYRIRRIKYSRNILGYILECSDSLYDQVFNNRQHLFVLSKKYSENAFFYVLSIGTNTAGIISFYANDNQKKIGYLSMVVVKKEYQGLRLGSILLDVALSICKIQGMSTLRLEVNIDNNKALSFYDRKGFETFEKTKKGTLILSKDI